MVLAGDIARADVHFERRSGCRPQRILVVDDSSDVRSLWKCFLDYCGFDVQEAENGLEAVRHACADPPRLIVMDLAMPIMDGWRALKHLKAAPQTAGVPVLMITAQGSEGAKSRALEAGCAAFLTKPCDPDDLLRHIRRAMRGLRRYCATTVEGPKQG